MAYARILPSILRAKQCTGKVQHKSRSAATKAMRDFAKNRLNGHTGGLNAYHCNFCDKYHFGHAPKMMEGCFNAISYP